MIINTKKLLEFLGKVIIKRPEISNLDKMVVFGIAVDGLTLKREVTFLL